MDIWLAFVLGVFSVWRITHLFSVEDGPWDVFLRLRRSLGNGFWGQLTGCFYCLSVWVSLPFALVLGESYLEKFMLCWAMSGAAILLQRFSEKDHPIVHPNQFEEK
ncbi:MAG: hypothetical protein DYG98_13055 [Haliscomenobacteraceae bacterium CHB4]|nr:hypothetical protein [Haliscomenobacteraceae bacterium CHB4]